MMCLYNKKANIHLRNVHAQHYLTLHHDCGELG